MTDKPKTDKPKTDKPKTLSTEEKLAAIIELLRANGMTIPQHLD